MSVFKIGLDKLGSELLKEFAKELINQGHKATGSLISSLRKDILFAPSSYRLVFYANDYGMFLETGRRAGKHVPIAPLMKWVATKGLASTNKEVRSIAYAISKTIAKEGIPTRGSHKFSKNGRRTLWITATITNNRARISNAIRSSFKEDIEVNMRNIIRETNNKLRT